METSKTKLKDLKYEINGYESKRPGHEILECIGIALLVAICAMIGTLFFLKYW